MDYNFSYDLIAIREIMGMTQEEFARALGVERVTISRNELELSNPSSKLMGLVYSFAFSHNIRINEIKSMFHKERLSSEHKLLYHGAKNCIDGDLDISRGRVNNDFGQGFYAGESYEQAISYVSGYDKSSVYLLDFDDSALKHNKYNVDNKWMLTIAYYRGGLDKYKNHPILKKIVEDSRDCDYIIAPIADNRMFQIIDSFVSGEITDEQCRHCLAATNLGYQYVFISDKALKKVNILERCYLSDVEKKFFREKRLHDSRMGEDKVKLARINYRGKGKYIDELLG